jgi:hypothetical protein
MYSATIPLKSGKLLHFCIKKENVLILFPENYYFVFYKICIAHLLKVYGSRVFIANLTT